MWKILVLTLVAFAAAEKASYQNYKVFRAIPITEDQVATIRGLETVSDSFNFWSEPSTVYKPVDIMVAPHMIPEFTELMRNAHISFESYIDDVQSLIDVESAQTKSYAFDSAKYNTLEEIYAQLDQLAARFPGKVQVLAPGKTYEGRQIKGVKISFKANNPGIFIEGGIHAREWISPATVMYITHQLLTSTNADVRALAESHDWYIFPSFNPDGYVYTHTTNRLWRKTRAPYGLLCYGTDPNRNWGYKWNTGGASSIPCTETYAGPAPFSDIETKSMSDYIKSISDKFYAYISFHSYSQLLLFPYGHTREHLENYKEQLDIGEKTIAALSKRYGTQYVTGNIAETIYVATGGSTDWVKATLKKPLAYTYELRDRGRHGFILPPNQIIPTGEETLDSLVAMFKAAKKYGYDK